MENKAQFVAELGDLLSLHSCEGIRWLKYHKYSDDFEAVDILFKSGAVKTVNVTGDSCVAIMLDVAKALIY